MQIPFCNVSRWLVGRQKTVRCPKNMINLKLVASETTKVSTNLVLCILRARQRILKQSNFDCFNAWRWQWLTSFLSLSCHAASPSFFETFSCSAFNYLRFPHLIPFLNVFIVSKTHHDDKHPKIDIPDASLFITYIQRWVEKRKFSLNVIKTVSCIYWLFRGDFGCREVSKRPKQDKNRRPQNNASYMEVSHPHIKSNLHRRLPHLMLI